MALGKKWHCTNETKTSLVKVYLGRAIYDLRLFY